MPNRILKESICTSDNIDVLSSFQETVFYRLIVTVDDFGRYDARPKILASRLFPLKDIRTTQIEDALRALTSAELVTLYEVDGKPFLQMNTWDRHQIKRATKSKYPGPDEGTCNHLQSIASNCMQMQADSSDTRKRETRNDKRESGTDNARAARFTPPTVGQVSAYAQEKGYAGFDAERFCDFYASNGWKVGKNPMKDWQAAVRGWASRDKEKSQMVGDGNGGKIVNPALNFQQRDNSDYSTDVDNSWMGEFMPTGG